MPRPMAPPMPPGNTPIGVELNPLAPSLDGLLLSRHRRDRGDTLDGNSALCISTMSTAPFGRGGRPRKPRPLVETVPRISVRDLARSPFTPRAREVNVVVNGTPQAIELMSDPRFFGGAQTFFLCPGCSRKCRHLYLRDDPTDGRRLACRQCSGLDYASRHVRRRGLHRVRDLRRRLGAPANILAPLPPRPLHWRRDYWARTVAELARAEAAIAAQLHAIIPRVRRRLT
jgi:hypothetical protein